MQPARRLPESAPGNRRAIPTGPAAETHGSPGRLRRVERAPALVMVLAPVIGLALWAALILLVF